MKELRVVFGTELRDKVDDATYRFTDATYATYATYILQHTGSQE